MMVRDGVVITPPVTSDILESITRTTLIALYRDELRVPVVEREIDRTELYIADKTFFCGAGTRCSRSSRSTIMPSATARSAR
jgi:branched-chain amino acid aminotransferase